MKKTATHSLKGSQFHGCAGHAVELILEYGLQPLHVREQDLVHRPVVPGQVDGEAVQHLLIPPMACIQHQFHIEKVAWMLPVPGTGSPWRLFSSQKDWRVPIPAAHGRGGVHEFRASRGDGAAP